MRSDSVVFYKGERLMGKCEAGHYTDNIVITHFPIMCFGFNEQPPCNYLRACAEERIKPAIQTERRWKNFEKKFIMRETKKAS